MDGNGRWARQRGFRRLRGHEEGAQALRRITRYSAQIGIEEITFYALSTENYLRRPKTEVQFLMRLLKNYLIGERQELADGNIRLQAIGRTWELPEDVQEELARTLQGSAAHDGMVLRLALNYGGRREILDAIARLVEEAAAGRRELRPAAQLSESNFRRFLYDPAMTDPDLIIRTAGEARLSNFLLWQASYAELWVTEALWPDFEPARLQEALQFYATRCRKFGGLAPEEVDEAVIGGQ